MHYNYSMWFVKGYVNFSITKINKENNQTTMADYTGNLFKLMLNYKRDFNPDKKAPEYTMLVAYDKMVEDEDKNTISRFSIIWKVLQHKETVQKFQGASVEELLYTILRNSKSKQKTY